MSLRRDERAAVNMFRKGSEWSKMDSRTAARVAQHDPEFESVSEGVIISPRQARDRTRRSKEIERLSNEIEKKRKQAVRYIKAGRLKDAQTLQSEVGRLQTALENRQREMSRFFGGR